jgi:twitching motility protein PilT
MSTKQKESFLKNLELDFWITAFNYRFRVNIFAQRKWIAAVFRIIKWEIPKFENLNLPPSILEFAKKKSGLILVTWSVWSGKSTTLWSLLNYINNNYNKHIITVEDPIEFVYKNGKSLVEQREVWKSTLSFQNALKYALRQAPDVMMIWEMRDLESFRLALTAAETGTLVLATLHTSSATKTITRIIDMFPWDEKNRVRAQLTESLIWVAWQELVKKEWWWRAALCEVLINNFSVSNTINENKLNQLTNIIETGQKEWMVSVERSLDDLISKWLISQETYDTNKKRFQKQD